MKALPILGAAVLLTSLTSNGFAEEMAVRYWVVGSFETLVSATRESARIENITGLPVRIARFDLATGRLYRLVIAQDSNPVAQKRTLEAEGIDTWSVPLSARQLDFDQPVDATDTSVAYHLIIGAYKDRERASDHVATLRDRGTSNAVVLEAGSGLFRVGLGPFSGRDRDAKRRADSLGVSGAWWLETVEAMAPKKSIPPVEQEVAKRSMRRSVTKPEKPVEPKRSAVGRARPINPPKPGESYIDYCAGRATARERAMFCENGRFSSRVTDGASGSTLIEFCASASASERAKYCDNQTFAGRVLP
jgi:hypothetical protein